MNVISQAGSKLENQFVVNSLIPASIFLPVTLYVVLESLWGFTPLLDKYFTLPQAIQIALPVAILASIWLVASIVASQWLFIVQVFEGYYILRAWNRLTAWRILKKILGRLEAPGASGQLFRRTIYKHKSEDDPAFDSEFDMNFDTGDPYVLPTSLGNIMNGAEQYPKHRYGIDSIVFWTRLAMLLPEHVLQGIETLISRYQLPLVIAAWGLFLWCLAFVPVLCGREILFRNTLWSGFLICMFGYRISLRSARYYGIALRSAFDVYRERLSAAWPSLDNIKEERLRFHRLRDFVVRGRLNRIPMHKSPEWSGLSSRPKKRKSREEINSWRPRLWAFFFVSSLLVHGLGKLVITSRQDMYVVAARDIQAYESTTGALKADNRPIQRVPEEPLPVEYKDSPLIAKRSIRTGVIISRGDVVVEDRSEDVGGALTSFIEIPAPSTAIRQLDLRPGGLIDVILAGRADYKSDPDCRKAETGGVTRRLHAQVISIAPTNNAQRSVTVGLTEKAAPVLACYGLNRAFISRFASRMPVRLGVGTGYSRPK